MKTLRAFGMWGSTVFIYLGVSLLGWGLPNLFLYVPEFFASPPRLAYSLAVMLFGVLIGVQSYHSLAGIQDGKGLEETKVSRQTIIGVLLVIILFVALFLLPLASRRAIGVFVENPVAQWLGALLCGLGYLLVFWSGLALGRQYSAEVVLQKDHLLVTSGPYRLIRHPRYLGILCLSLGLSLLFCSWFGLALSLPVIGLILARIYDEERLLQSAFGEAWQKYCRQSWRLLPYLY